MYHLTWFSQDTVEAKLLQPAIDADVTLYEDVARTARYIAKNKVLRQISKKKTSARNPISAMSQSTRWMLGEVRNCCYEASGILASGSGWLRLISLYLKMLALGVALQVQTKRENMA